MVPVDECGARTQTSRSTDWLSVMNQCRPADWSIQGPQKLYSFSRRVLPWWLLAIPRWPRWTGLHFFLLFSFFLEGGSVSLKGRFLFRTAMCTTRLMSFFCVFIDGVRRETSATVWRPHPSVLSSTAQMDAFRRLHSINGTNLTRWYRFFLVRHLSSRLYGTELNRLHDRNGCGGGCNSVLELSFFFYWASLAAQFRGIRIFHRTEGSLSNLVAVLESMARIERMTVLFESCREHSATLFEMRASSPENKSNGPV